MTQENVQTATTVEGPSLLARLPKKKIAIVTSVTAATVLAGVLVNKYGIPVPARFVKDAAQA